jgi:hypothetical protein
VTHNCLFALAALKVENTAITKTKNCLFALAALKVAGSLLPFEQVPVCPPHPRVGLALGVWQCHVIVFQVLCKYYIAIITYYLLPVTYYV